MHSLVLQFVDDRVGLVQHVVSLRPLAVLLPPLDAAGSGSAPLIARLGIEAPDIRRAVLIRVGESAGGVIEAARAGAEIHEWATVADLTRIVTGFIDQTAGVPTDMAAIGALIADLHPNVCVMMLLHCVERAPRQLSVDDVAAAFNVSRRTLCRWMQSNGWPAPSELIEWGRLLAASVIHWRVPSSTTALAHAVGFSSPAALRRARARLMGPDSPVVRELVPLQVATMLRRRIEKLSRKARAS